MIKQEFEEGTEVFKFYFDRYERKLSYRHLPIGYYNHMDGMDGD